MGHALPPTFDDKLRPYRTATFRLRTASLLSMYLAIRKPCWTTTGVVERDLRQRTVFRYANTGKIRVATYIGNPAKG